MALTTAQLQALQAEIEADPALDNQPMTPDGHVAVAAALNLSASPDFWVWRTSVSKAEYTQFTSVDGTTFNWTGAGFITRSQGERDAWHELFNSNEACNPSLANVRQAFQDIFSGGTAPAPANRTHLATVSRRKATRAEKLLATGTGSTASPAVMGFEGDLSGDDVALARSLP
jgi:hypothetical protein